VTMGFIDSVFVLSLSYRREVTVLYLVELCRVILFKEQGRWWFGCEDEVAW